jgi:hypothetical protein
MRYAVVSERVGENHPACGAASTLAQPELCVTDETPP